MRYRKDGKVCIQCGKILPSNRTKYCSYECGKLRRQEQWQNLNPARGKTSATTGAIGELRVAIDLLIKGYNVFRALSPSCPCDLAILKDGKLLRLEVRTGHLSITGKVYKVISKKDDKTNIDHYAWVLPDKIIYEPSLP